MTRKKVKLMWIVNDSARKVSLKKRREGLLKKVSELATLCDVNVFIIIYSPDEREPLMWPSRPVVEQLLVKFSNTPEMEKTKRMMSQESYIKETIGKIQDQQKKLERGNKEMDVSQVMEKLNDGKTIDDLYVNELHDLIWFCQEKMKEIRKKIEFYQQVNPLTPGSLPPLPSLPPQLLAPVDSTAGVGGNISGEGRNPPESGLLDQWFNKMMKSRENNAGSSSAKAKSDADLPSHQAALGASSGVVNQMGLPHVNPMDYNVGSAMGMMSQGNINIGGSSSSLIGGSNGSSDGNMGQPQGNAGEASNAASRAIGLPSELFWGSIARSDVGMTFDVNKQWPGNFYP